MKKIADSTREQIVSMYRSGKLHREISEETGVSMATVGRICREAGLDKYHVGGRMSKTCPVTNDAPSEQRNAAASATSSGVPRRPNGVSTASSRNVSAPNTCTISVLMTPGARQFTRIPDGASSSASERVSAISPAFVQA